MEMLLGITIGIVLGICIFIGIILARMKFFYERIKDLLEAVENHTIAISNINKTVKNFNDYLNEPQYMGSFSAKNPEELFKKLQDKLGVNIKEVASEEIDELGRNKEWYIKELTRMNKSFNPDVPLQELIDLYNLF